MPIIFEQRFPLGRFHATRWNQNPYEDRHGEWPPSPWRLLRTLASRWIQYSRETGDEVEAAKGKKDAAYKKSMTTLVPDHYRAIPPDQPVFWIWNSIELPPKLLGLLDCLLNRIVYFGRAETLCRISRTSQLPSGYRPNCVLSSSATDGAPVLVAKPDLELNLSTLLASTSDKLLTGRSIPPGAAWFYAKLPQRPTVGTITTRQPRFPEDMQVIQFAVGGRVFPPLAQWIRVTERFRGIALKRLARQVSNGTASRFADLSADECARFSLLTGKSSDGKPMTGHQHAYFALVPDAMGQPTRLVCFRQIPFTSDEVTALLAASEDTITWQPQNRDWWVRLVPLPFETPPPLGFGYDAETATVWESASPFVTPGKRMRFRKNRRPRPGETPERLLEKLLVGQGLPTPTIKSLSDDDAIEWVAVHETPEQRAARRENRSRAVLPAYRFQLTFPKPVSGPMCVGHSCHFGLGLFQPVDVA